MTLKKYFILILFIFIISCNNTEELEHNNKIIDTFIIRYINQTTASSRCFFIEPIEEPVLYAGVPNILRYSEDLKGSIYIVMKDAKVRLLNNNLCEITPLKVGPNILSVYKKKGHPDSSLVIRRKIKVKKLKKPTTHISWYKNIARESLLALDKLDCDVVNLPIEIVCKIKSFSIISFVDNDEIEVSSSNNKFTQKQKELIKKVKTGNHIIFKDIIAEMPNGDLGSVPDFILRVK